MLRDANSKLVARISVYAVWIAVSLPLLAANAGSISGVVKDSAGKPAVGASVKVKNTERGVAFLVISQDRGRYKASNLPPGKYTVQAFGGGMQSEANAAVDVDGGRPATKDLALTAPQEFKKTVNTTQSAAYLPDGEAKTTIVGICTDCHVNGLQEIMFARKTPEGWAATLEKMQNHPYGNARSLDMTAEQKPLVLDYLVKNFGPDAPPFDTKGKVPVAWTNGTAMKGIVTELDLPKGANAHDVAVDSKGVAWVAEGGHGVIGRLDPETLEYKRITVPGNKSGATAITLDAQDHVWLGDGTNNRIIEYDPATNAFSFFPLGGPEGSRKNLNTIRFHPDGTIWATEISSNAIVHLDPATKKVSEYPVPAGIAMKSNVNPYGMAIDGDNWVWFAERRSDKVAKVNPKTGEITEIDVPTKGAVLRRMAADTHGDLWFGEFGNVGKLAKIDHRTGKITEYPTPTKYSGAYSVDIDRKRDLIWVNEMMADKIARFDPRTKTFTEYSIPTVYSSVRRIEADPSRPYRVWYSGLDVDTVGFLDVVE